MGAIDRGRRWPTASCRPGTPIRRTDRLPTSAASPPRKRPPSRAGSAVARPRASPPICRPRRSIADGWSIGKPDVVLVDAGGLSDSGHRHGAVPCTSRFPRTSLRTAGFRRGRCKSGQSRRRASRHRVDEGAGAAAGRPAAAGATARGPAARRVRCRSSRFAGGTDIPAGQTGGDAAAGRISVPRQPERSAAPARHGAVDWRLRSRQFDSRLPRGHGDAPAGRPLARAADALHADGQGDDGPHARGAEVRARGAEDRRCTARGADQRRPAHSGPHREPSRSTPR